MKRAPTPETDEQHKAMPMGGFTLDFVGELENERDEAVRSCHIWQKGHAELVKERDKWAGLYDAAIAERDNALSDWRQADTDSIRAFRERNEAREQRDRLAKALEQLMTYQPRSTVIAMNEHHVWRDAREALRSITPKP